MDGDGLTETRTVCILLGEEKASWTRIEAEAFFYQPST